MLVSYIVKLIFTLILLYLDFTIQRLGKYCTTTDYLENTNP